MLQTKVQLLIALFDWLIGFVTYITSGTRNTHTHTNTHAHTESPTHSIPQHTPTRTHTHATHIRPLSLSINQSPRGVNQNQLPIKSAAQVIMSYSFFIRRPSAAHTEPTYSLTLTAHTHTSLITAGQTASSHTHTHTRVPAPTSTSAMRTAPGHPIS